MLRVRLLMLVLGTVLAATAARAAAATITVNTTFDETAGTQCSLRQAILDVDSPGSAMGGCTAAAFGSNTIVLGPSTYALGPAFPSPGPLTVSPTVTKLTLIGSSEGKTVIDAAALNDRALVVDAGANVTLSNLTIANAHAQAGTAGAAGTGGTGGAGDNGGAILNQGALTITDAAVTNSQAGAGGAGGTGISAGTSPGGTGGQGGSGGAIYNIGTLTLTGATIGGNQAGIGGAGGAGGRLNGDGGAGGIGGLGGAGGGIANVGGTLTVTATTIHGNSAGGGGGGATGASVPSLANNAGDGGAGGSGNDGGGVTSQGGSISITNSTIASNTAGAGASGGGGGGGGAAGGTGGAGGAGGVGGGVSVTPFTNETLQSDTFAGNSAGDGGTGGVGGAANTAGANGAAGHAGTGGGIYDLGTQLTVQNTLLASNSGGNCNANSLIDSGHNLSFGDSSCPGTFATGDPNLGPLADNGGPSETISLGPDSAAIDKIPPGGAGCPATDQRGVPRPSGPGCDIGAYELAPPIATTAPATKITNGGATLNAIVTPNAGPTTVTFDYGTSTRYGKTVDVAGITGVTAVAAAARIRKLKPGTTYHFRVVAMTMDGSANGADRTFKTASAPALSALKVKGSRISYRDSEPATTSFKLVRGHKTIASFRHRDKAGANKVSFNGRPLKRGKYVLEATPKLGREAGATVSVTFRIT